MHITVQVKLIPNIEQAKLLNATIREGNAAANRISEIAWDKKEFGRFKLHKLVYVSVRKEFPLSAQIVCLLLAKVADAYKLDKKVQREFRSLGSIAYDSRILAIDSATKMVSIWAIGGRLKMPFVCGAKQLKLLALPHGQADLIYRKGSYYLNVTVDVPEEKEASVIDVLGVDMGIVEIAYDSDGNNFSGWHLNKVRNINRSIRMRLQSKGTKSAKRLLKKRAKKETNFARNTNHVISRRIVDNAKRTNRAIAIEDLAGIRSRVRARKQQRSKLSSWAFAQLGAFLEYKAKLLGVVLLRIDPRHTSQRCNKCGHTEKANRKSQSVFACKSCGHTANADLNGAGNIRSKGLLLLGSGTSVARTFEPLCESRLAATYNPQALA